MKEFWMMFVGVTLAGSVFASSTGSHSFVAPSFADRSEVLSPRIGTIIYETTTDKLLLVGPAGWSTMARGYGVVPSIATADGNNGYGFNNNVIRCFLHHSVQGSAIQYAPCGADGDVFEIEESGVYAVTYFDETSNFGISLNSASLTTAIQNLSRTERILMSTWSGTLNAVTFSIFLNAGSKLRAHTDRTVTAVGPIQIKIVKVDP